MSILHSFIIVIVVYKLKAPLQDIIIDSLGNRYLNFSV